ncbi:SURF1 family cytochrome oxidase biogenesis protein [Streptomonospora wellingtoniae]|uniref:SURF1-like protein n=1 Tax=Streptomonospora wellingtoniae TaxID=3075544 RepID=A0ABU2KZN2_9ACTN|nr:SURF1 family cytochrome oxidase biogenesis protein [Streptomonospora sp. DSM 45055]MDT0304771.1 SURF1 family cytochrome oxidase biogenesis protein [Streptomonospora sp. DSM 45055]
MLRILLSPRMLAFHALVALIVPSFIWLGFWQLHRWEDKSAAVALQEENMASAAVPADRLTSPGEDVSAAEQWRRVTATGHYDAEHELLVRNRDGSGGVGLHVLTPLVTDGGTALLVNRGWIEQPPTATARPDVPAPPEGQVTVTGRLRFSETEESTGIRVRGGLPEGQVMLIDVDRIAGDLPYPVYGGYAELTEQRPEGAEHPEAVPSPEMNTGMNLSYAVQWWVFTLIAVGGWVFLMRREVAEARSGGGGTEDSGSGSGADSPGGDGADGRGPDGGAPGRAPETGLREAATAAEAPPGAGTKAPDETRAERRSPNADARS